MSRFTRIEEVRFGGRVISLPLSVRLGRRSEAIPGMGDGDLLPSAIQIGSVTILVEVRVRDCQAAEELSLGDQGQLRLVMRSSDGQRCRQITLACAVLTASEIQYEQHAPASALLKFAACNYGNEPYEAEEIE